MAVLPVREKTIGVIAIVEMYKNMLSFSINAGCRGNENLSTRNVRKIFRLLQRKLRATAVWEYT